MVERVLLDTNVLVSAMLGEGGSSRGLLRLCLTGKCRPCIGEKLFQEIEDVFGRARLFEGCKLNETERDDLLNAYFSVCEWTEVYYLWRPNLLDEGDNHIIELAVAAGVDTIVTHNIRDIIRGELRFDIRVQSPADYLNSWRDKYGNNDNQNV